MLTKFFAMIISMIILLSDITAFAASDAESIFVVTEDQKDEVVENTEEEVVEETEVTDCEETLETDEEAFIKTGYFAEDEQKYYADRNGILQSGWIKLADEWKYFDESQGFIEITSETIDGRWYYLTDGRISYFDKKTTLIQNSWKTIGNQKYYFDDAGFVVKGWHQDGTYWYYANEAGQMVKGVHTIGEDARNYYFDSNCRLSTGWKKIDGIYRYFHYDEHHEKCYEVLFDGTDGWITSVEDGRKCYIGEKGPSVGWKNMDGHRYHFDGNGFLNVGLFQEGRYHYFAETEETMTEESPLGNVVKGVKKIGENIYGFHPEKYYRISGWRVLGGQRYYFKDDCSAVIGWYREGNNWYYANSEGVMSKGETRILDHTYYFDNNYCLRTGWVKIDNEIRYFQKSVFPEECYEIELVVEAGWYHEGKYWYYTDFDGVRAKGETVISHTTEDGDIIEHIYYFDSNYRLKTGWTKINNIWRYFEDADTPEQCYETASTLENGWLILNDESGRKAYVNKKNALVKGWLTVDNQKYYFDSTGMIKTGYFTVGTKKYYANEQGVVEQQTSSMKSTWWENEGHLYYFNSKGQLVKGFHTINKQRFYFNSAGELQTGWFTVGTDLYYGEPETSEETLKGTLARGVKEIVRVNGIKETYFFHAKSNYRLTGWQTINKKRYYLKVNGTAQTGWFALDGKIYYGEPETTEDGVLKGTVAVGAKEINGKTYIFHSSKYYRLSGWQTVNKKRFYLKSDGTAQTGWFKVGNKWYYGEPETTEEGILKGTLAKGLKTIITMGQDGFVERTYYFDSNYRLATGWKTISKMRYFFQKDKNPEKCYLICQGPSKTGWFTFEDGKMSYLNSKGKFVTGWQTIAKKKYYFDSAGIMQTGWRTIGGKEYYFNSEGIYIPMTVPSIVTLTSTEYETIDVKWKAVSGAKSYTIQYSKEKTFPSWSTKMVFVTDLNTTKARVEGLEGNEVYYFRICYTVWGDEAASRSTYSSYSAIKKVTVQGEIEPTADAAKISECRIVVGSRNDGIKVNLKASFGVHRIKSADDQYYIVETESYGNEIDLMEPVAKIPKDLDINTMFDIEAEGGDVNARQAVNSALMNKFALAIKNENGEYQIISEPVGISNPELISENKTEVFKPVSKKGIQAVALNERKNDGSPEPMDGNAYGSNTKNTLFNIHINDLVGTAAGDGFRDYQYKGKTYYFSDCAAEQEMVRNLVKGYPQYIKPGVDAINQVSVTFVLLLEYGSETTYLIDPAARTKGHKYYTLNVREEEARETLEALFLYLGEIFGREDCYVTHWVLGNEVNSSKAWNYQGSLSFAKYMKSYASAFRLLYTGVKAGKTGNNVYISLDNGWKAAPDTYSGKTTLDKFAEYAQKENEDMLWSIAYHGYSYPLTRNDFWNDSKNTTSSVNTKYISMKNISVLTNYATALEKKYDKPSGSIRVILSEQGYNGKTNPTSQAQALARGYYMAEFNDRIDAFIIRSIIDDMDETSGGLHLGIRKLNHEKRIAYFVYEYMDSNLEYMKQLIPQDIVSRGNVDKFKIAQKILCETNWEKLIPNFQREKLAAMH